MENKLLAIESINKIFARRHNNPDLSLNFSKLDLDSISLKVYKDASFAANYDHSSHLGCIIFFVDKYKVCQPIHWPSYKPGHFLRPIHGSKVVAAADAFDLAYTIECVLQVIEIKSIEVLMVNERLSFFGILTKATMTTKKLITNELKTVKKFYLKLDVKTFRLLELNKC